MRCVPLATAGRDLCTVWATTAKDLSSLRKRKKSISPQTMRGATHHPQPMKMDLLPLNFLKRNKSPPEATLKNHSKSHKNHKIEIQIVLDFKLIVLHSEHII
jgi:hypothetical protein